MFTNREVDSYTNSLSYYIHSWTKYAIESDIVTWYGNTFIYSFIIIVYMNNLFWA